MDEGWGHSTQRGGQSRRRINIFAPFEGFGVRAALHVLVLVEVVLGERGDLYGPLPSGERCEDIAEVQLLLHGIELGVGHRAERFTALGHQILQVMDREPLPVPFHVLVDEVGMIGADEDLREMSEMLWRLEGIVGVLPAGWPPGLIDYLIVEDSLHDELDGRTLPVSLRCEVRRVTPAFRGYRDPVPRECLRVQIRKPEHKSQLLEPDQDAVYEVGVFDEVFFRRRVVAR